MSIRATSCRAIDSPVAKLEPSAAHNGSQQPHAEHAGEHEADEREDVHPEKLRPGGGERPDQGRPDEAADDDQGDDEAVDADVDLVHELVEPLVHEARSEEHTSELQSHSDIVCRLLLEKKKKKKKTYEKKKKKQKKKTK